MVAAIPLSQGKFAIVDDDDFERLSQFNWYIKNKKGWTTPYASRALPGHTAITMHQELLKLGRFPTEEEAYQKYVEACNSYRVA